MNEPEKIGILGGMGPEATIYQYQLIVKHTPVSKDQDHIPTIIYSNPLIPDRTTCILNNSHEGIISALSQSAKIIESAGASFIIIPCNTAHYYIDHVRNSVSIPVLDMIEISAQKVNEEYEKKKLDKNSNVIGLLASSGVVNAKVYHKRFENKNLRIKTPNDEDQEKVMKIIYKIKENGVSDDLKMDSLNIIMNLMKENSLTHIILGCTELPLLYPNEKRLNGSILIDPMEILAKHIIMNIKGKIKSIT